MLDYYSDRYPKVFGLLLVMLITAVPMLLMFILSLFIGYDFNAAPILMVFAFAVQILLCFRVENMLHMMLPFVVMLTGTLVCECLYLSSEVTYDAGAFNAVEIEQLLLWLGTSTFAPEFVGVAVALIAYAVISVVRSFIS